jgi:hypothetical protein
MRVSRCTTLTRRHAVWSSSFAMRLGPHLRKDQGVPVVPSLKMGVK